MLLTKISVENPFYSFRSLMTVLGLAYSNS